MTSLTRLKNSEFVRSERCPKCVERGKDRHGDNLSVWTDGHKYCFACGYFVPPQGIVIEQPKTAFTSREVLLPADHSPHLRPEAYNWLKQYQIRDVEIKKNNLMWSDQNKSLIFPIYNVMGKLVAYQERFFGENATKRWKTTGKIHETPLILSQKEIDTLAPECLILVEDVVSAMKVSRNFYCAPLFGNNPPAELIKNLRIGYDYAILWLDYDQKDSLYVRRNQLGMYFDYVGVVVTRNDPKAHKDEYIKREILNTWRTMMKDYQLELQPEVLH